jgi:hypothetical protein
LFIANEHTTIKQNKRNLFFILSILITNVFTTKTINQAVQKSSLPPFQGQQAHIQACSLPPVKKNQTQFPKEAHIKANKAKEQVA